MLGGMADSDTAQAHARELLESAEQERTAAPVRSPSGPAGQHARIRERRTGEPVAASPRRRVRPSSGEDAPDSAPTRP
jgi:hypothetical protein